MQLRGKQIPLDILANVFASGRPCSTRRTRSRKMMKSNAPIPYNIPFIDDVPNFTLSNINLATCNTFDLWKPNLDEEYLKGMVEEQDTMHSERKVKDNQHQVPAS